MPVGEGGVGDELLKNPVALGGVLGKWLAGLIGSTKRLRGDGGEDELADPGKLSCSMRKYSGLTKPGAEGDMGLP